jgi:DNA replication protein DnaC
MLRDISHSMSDSGFTDAILRITMDSALNRSFKEWPKIFNNDSTLTSAILDRLLHHSETILIEGKSYRMKGEVES